MSKILDFKLHSFKQQLNESLSDAKKAQLMTDLKLYCDELGVSYNDVCKTLKVGTGGLEKLDGETILWLDRNIGLGKWLLNPTTNKIDIHKGGGFSVGWNDRREITELPADVSFGTVDGNFNVEDCPKMKSFRGFPSKITGKLNIKGCAYESLEHCPTDVGSIDFSFNRIKKIDGGPQDEVSYYNCSNNYITSLEGAPKKVLDGFNCSNNELETLEGGPKIVEGGSYYANFNSLDNLRGFPNKFSGNYIHVESNNLHSLQGINPMESKKSVYCKKNLLPEAVLKDTYSKAREFGSWPAGYLWLLTTTRFQRMSKLQRDPIREALSPENIKKHSIAFSKVWKTSLMDDPAVKRIMNKANLSAEYKEDATLGADMDDLGF